MKEPGLDLLKSYRDWESSQNLVCPCDGYDSKKRVEAGGPRGAGGVTKTVISGRLSHANQRPGKGIFNPIDIDMRKWWLLQ